MAERADAWGMRISLNVTNYSYDGDLADGLTRAVRAADEGGLDTVWVSDHLLQAEPGTTVEAPMLEAYATLSYLAAHTSRVRLGAMVTAATYRAPALLLKTVSTLDALSHGRAWLGLGAGYQQMEADAYGLDLPATRERYERLEELLRLAQQMFVGDDRPFEGGHYRLARPLNHPLPAARPPILIGGMGERRTLPLVARYADACNLFDIPDGGATVRHKLDVLRRLCDEAGRAYDAVQRTISTRLNPDESAAAFAGRLAALADLGIEHAVVLTVGPWTEARVATLVSAGH
jgi:F420-dependent oxidoreductase-like protein